MIRSVVRVCKECGSPYQSSPTVGSRLKDGAVYLVLASLTGVIAKASLLADDRRDWFQFLFGTIFAIAAIGTGLACLYQFARLGLLACHGVRGFFRAG